MLRLPTATDDADYPLQTKVGPFFIMAFPVWNDPSRHYWEWRSDGVIFMRSKETFPTAEEALKEGIICVLADFIRMGDALAADLKELEKLTQAGSGTPTPSAE